MKANVLEGEKRENTRHLFITDKYKKEISIITDKYNKKTRNKY